MKQSCAVGITLDGGADGAVVGRILKVLDVDARVLAPRKSHADAQVCCDPRGSRGSLRQELAAGIGRSLINAQIAAPAFLGHNHRLSKKSHSLPIVARAHNSNRSEASRDRHQCVPSSWRVGVQQQLVKETKLIAALKQHYERYHAEDLAALKDLYGYHAENCVRAAELTVDRRRREEYLKLAREWTEASIDG
jgi:hypothetical protein